jgi:hypothetical protein
MILVVMSKKFGQISYSVPDETKNLCVSVDDEKPFVLRNHEDIIEPLKSFRIENDEVIRLDPLKKL